MFKKGLMESTLVKILLAVAFMTVVIMILYPLVDVSVRQKIGVGINEYTCYYGNRMKSSMKGLFFDSCGDKPVGIIHEPIDIAVKTGDIELVRYVEKCWEMYGAGKLDIRGIRQNAPLFELAGLKRCYVITFTQDLEKEAFDEILIRYSMGEQVKTEEKSAYSKIGGKNIHVCLKDSIVKKNQILFIDYYDGDQDHLILSTTKDDFKC